MLNVHFLATRVAGLIDFPPVKWLSESWLEMVGHIDTYGSPNKGLFLFVSIKRATTALQFLAPVYSTRYGRQYGTVDLSIFD